MLTIMYVGLGGAIGAIARYGVALGINRITPTPFPISTILINVSGSLLIGFLWGVTTRMGWTPSIQLFVFTGVLGGYTTFSTFSLETLLLIQSGNFRAAVINVAGSVVFGLAAVVAGLAISNKL